MDSVCSNTKIIMKSSTQVLEITRCKSQILNYNKIIVRFDLSPCIVLEKY